MKQETTADLVAKEAVLLHVYAKVCRVLMIDFLFFCYLGRPEKLPDVCYSWWVLASLKIIGRIDWIHRVRSVAC